MTTASHYERAAVQRRIADGIRIVPASIAEDAAHLILTNIALDDEQAFDRAGGALFAALAACAKYPAILDAVRQVAQVHALTDEPAAAPVSARHEVYRAIAGRVRATLADAHDLAMSAKECTFKAQDACSLAWEHDPDERKTLRKVERRLARVRAELEALDTDVAAAEIERNARAARKDGAR